MHDEKVAAIRQQLFDVAENIMGARNLVGLLTLASVDIKSVRNKIRDADAGLMKVWDALSNEDGLTDLELAIALLLVVIIVLVILICLLAGLAVPKL